MSDIEV
jgi:hypothetical protein